MNQARTRRDPVADKNSLLTFLCNNSTERFSAGELKARTGVPKNHVRRHLSGESNVKMIADNPRKTFYQCNSSASS